MNATEIKKIAQDVIKELSRSLGGPTSSAGATARYVGAKDHPQRKKDEQSALVFWGHSSPSMSAALQSNPLAKVSPEEFSLGDQWKIWQKVWEQTNVHELKAIALSWMGSKKLQAERRKHTADLLKMASSIDNWALSDSLSSMLAENLEDDRKILKIYQKWNRHKNPWLRRQSIVGIYCYARSRKKHVAAAVALRMIAPLLNDPHFYVQRGVGWTLREVDRVDSKLQRNFVKKNLHKIGSTAWFATTELYPEKLRKELVALRKEKRKQI